MHWQALPGGKGREDDGKKASERKMKQLQGGTVLYDLETKRANKHLAPLNET
jgi:hypothetical protein